MRRQSFNHVFWLGGAPCASKSAVATALVEGYGHNLYRCEEHFPRHVQEADPREHPNLYRLAERSGDEKVTRTVEDQVAAQIAVYREQFSHIAEDLRAYPHDPPLLVEGAALLPEIVVNLIPAEHYALFLVPTPAFRREQDRQRMWKDEILAPGRDREQAWADRMAQDEEFAHWVAATARHRGLSVLEVDGSRTLAENVARAARHFDFA